LLGKRGLDYDQKEKKRTVGFPEKNVCIPDTGIGIFPGILDIADSSAVLLQRNEF
jgi:hypothetical protein